VYYFTSKSYVIQTLCIVSHCSEPHSMDYSPKQKAIRLEVHVCVCWPKLYILCNTLTQTVQWEI